MVHCSGHAATLPALIRPSPHLHAVLYADEPTSGLDSSSSKALVAALKEVVRSGVTAAAVIHQPSWQNCLLFDDLLLLGKGGRTGAGGGGEAGPGGEEG